jgi:hypothetical protein
MINELLSWPLLRLWNVYGGESDFIDLRWFWYAAECFKKVGDDVYLPIGNFCGGYQYGKIPIELINEFGISEIWVQLCGYFLMIFYSYMMSGALLPVFRGMRYGSTLFFLITTSPPMMLFVQRGQIDLFVTLTVFLSLKIVSEKKGERNSSILLILFSALLLALATAIKIYPIIALLAIAIYSKSKKIILTYLFSAFLLLPSIYESLLLIPIKIAMPFGGTNMSFGFLNIMQRINETVSFSLGWLSLNILSLMLHLVLWVVFLIFKKYNDFRFMPLNDFSNKNNILKFRAWTTIFTGCYCLGSNIDFRAIFMILSIAYLLRIMRNSREKIFIALLMLVNVTLSFASGGLEIFGDLSMAGTVVLLVTLLFSTFRVPKNT